MSENFEINTEDVIISMFDSFRKEIDEEQILREQIQQLVLELESQGREMLVIMQKTHSLVDSKETKIYVNKVNEIIVEKVCPTYLKLAAQIPVNQYFKYHDLFRWITQRMSFLIAFLHFLTDGVLISWDQIAAKLGVKTKQSDGFHLDLEDYLFGMLLLASELARFSINSVAAGDNSRPFQIAKFLSSLDGKFRLLNLKNDSLRKKFDGLKYDVQKVEHVVYDLTIRGLKPHSETVSDTA